jgi:hypothetical protein
MMNSQRRDSELGDAGVWRRVGDLELDGWNEE